MSIVKMPDLGTFWNFVYEAANDDNTTGFFVYMLAPRKGNVTREASLAQGDLPSDLVERIRNAGRERLAMHDTPEPRTGRK